MVLGHTPVDSAFVAWGLLGAGTVRTPAEAIDAVAAGARYLVSPGTTDELAAAMLDTGATVLLGALTPSEVMRVSGLGAHAVKIFPANLGGPAYLRALRAPFPDLAFVPTGGVNPDTLPEWLLVAEPSAATRRA